MMYFIERQTLGAVQVQLVTKLLSSLINAGAGVLVAVLRPVLCPALKRAGLFRKQLLY